MNATEYWAGILLVENLSPQVKEHNLSIIQKALDATLAGVETVISTRDILERLFPDIEVLGTRGAKARSILGRLLVKKADTHFSRYCYRDQPTKIMGKSARRVLWHAPKPVPPSQAELQQQAVLGLLAKVEDLRAAMGADPTEFAAIWLVLDAADRLRELTP